MKALSGAICLCIILSAASFVFTPLCFAEVEEELYFMDIPTVMSAGFFVTDRNKAPGNSTVISDKLIETSSIRTLEDVLEFYVPGASIGRHHYNGTQVGFRGVKFDGSEKTLVLWNGQDISLSSVGEWGLYQAPLLGDVKRIEVIDGPGAIVHGSGAISGFVDIVTKNGTEYPGLNSGVEYGFQDQSKKMELSYGKSYGADRDIFIYAGWVQAAGIYPDKSYHELGNSDGTISPDSYNDPYTKDELDGRRALYNRYPTYRVSLNANCGDLNVSTFFHQYFQGTNDDYGINRYTSKNTFHLGYGIMPTYVFKLSEKNTIDFSLPCYFSDFGSDYESNDLTPVQSSRDNSREYNMEAKGIFKTTSFDNNSLALGALYNPNGFLPGAYFIGNVTNESIKLEEVNSSVFGEDVITLTDAWVASIGTRYDQVEPVKTNDLANVDGIGNFSSRVATSYQLNPETTVKLSFQQGFRYPDLGSMYEVSSNGQLLSDGGISWTPPELKPETMDNYELNLSKDFNDSKEKVELNMYYSTYRNLIMWGDISAPQDAKQYLFDQGVAWQTDFYEGTINSPNDFSSEGLELVYHWKPAKTTNVQLIYGYSRVASMTPSANAQLLLADNQEINWSRYPAHSLKANVSTLLFKKLNVNVAATYDSAYNVSDYPDTPGYGPVASALNQPRIVCDLALNYMATKDLSIKLNVKNAFENQVPLSGNYNWFPFPGQQGLFTRLVYLTVNYKIL